MNERKLKISKRDNNNDNNDDDGGERGCCKNEKDFYVINVI